MPGKILLDRGNGQGIRFAPSAWLEPEIPCHVCPSRHARLAKQPKAVYLYYKAKCRSCRWRDEYNRFYD